MERTQKKRTAAWVVALVAISSSAISSGRALRAETGDTQRQIAINEISYRLAERGQLRWIELCNYGDRPVDIVGWSVVDRDDRAFVIPSGVQPVPAKGYVVIGFDGPSSQAKASTPLDGIAAPVIMCRARWADKAFAGNGNECSLYCKGSRTKETLVDYVRWGRQFVGSTPHRARARDAGLWDRRRNDGIYVGAKVIPGDRHPLLPGGSLCRVPFGWDSPPGAAWFICPRTETTPGASNALPAPRIRSTQWSTIQYLESGRKTARVRLGGPWAAGTVADHLKPRFHIQAATDSAFRKLVVNVVQEHGLVDLPAGDYYWRVRVCYRMPGEKTDRKTKWSRTCMCTIEEAPNR